MEYNKTVCKACNPKLSAKYRTAAEFREALLRRGFWAGYAEKKQWNSSYRNRFIPGLAATKTVAFQRYTGDGANDGYYNQQSISDGGGGTNLIPGLVLIAAIMVIIESLVGWNLTQKGVQLKFDRPGRRGLHYISGMNTCYRTRHNERIRFIYEDNMP